MSNIMSPLGKQIKEINELHKGVYGGLKTTVEKAIKIGELLTECKEQVKHGEWEQFVRINCDFSEDMAQKYMKAYEKRDNEEYRTRAVFEGFSRALVPEKVQRKQASTPKIIDAEVVDVPKQLTHQEDKEVQGPIEVKNWAIRTSVLPDKWDTVIKDKIGETAVRMLDAYIDKHLEGVDLRSYTHINFTLSIQIVGKEKVAVKRKVKDES